MKKMLWLVLLVLTGLPAPGAGLIVVHEPDFWHPRPPEIIPPPRPRPIPPRRTWAPLEMSRLQADVQITEQVAKTSIEQEFYNPNAQQLEGTFLLPVPKGAHIDKFTMEIDGKQVHAELLAADKARNIYEDIVRKARDPALLEYSGRDLFKVRIFPIEPHSRKKITLSWLQVLKADSGILTYVFPLNTAKYSAAPIKNLSLKLGLESKRALKSVYSPSHKVEIKRHGDHKATVGFEAANVQPDADFQLLYSQEEGEFGANLLTHKKDGEDGYFLLLVSPAAELKGGKVLPKDVVFVLDTSGSMAGAKLEQAKKALLFCVENLNDNDRFDVIRFSTEVEALFDKLTDAEKDKRERASEFIRELKPTGGTAIDDALRKALAARPSGSGRPYVVIFLTDGRPTIGVTDEDKILKNVDKSNEANTRVFVFGIGTDVNTHLLDGIAEETKAFSQYVLPEEDIEVKVSNFYAKIKEPVLANPKITFPDDVRITKIYPSPIPDLFRGEQLVIAGRYSGNGSGKIKIEGTVNGESRVMTYNVGFPKDERDHEFIPRLWATRRVGYLLDEIRLRGENQELRDEVTDLARKYNIVTPYTTYLIMEDETRRGITQNFRSVRLQEESESARRELSFHYESLGRDRSGDLAVAGAQSTFRLKSADAPADAISQSTAAAERPRYLNSGAAPALAPGSVGQPVVTARPMSPTPQKVGTQVVASRFVAGRTFYLNGETWIDSELQKNSNLPRKRVQFGSPEYFELMRKNPDVVTWISLGRNLQFALAGNIYEIHE